MDVKGEDGKVVSWMIEGGSPNNLYRLGFTRIPCRPVPRSWSTATRPRTSPIGQSARTSRLLTAEGFSSACRDQNLRRKRNDLRAFGQLRSLPPVLPPHSWGWPSRIHLSDFARQSHRTDRAWGQIVPEDFSALHHKLHPLRFADIGERIAGNGDNVGKLALRNGADIVLPSHFRCGINRSGLQSALPESYRQY